MGRFVGQRVDGREVDVGEGDVEELMNAGSAKEPCEIRIVDLLGDFEVHAIEAGDAVPRRQSSLDVLHPSDGFGDGRHRWSTGRGYRSPWSGDVNRPEVHAPKIFVDVRDSELGRRIGSVPTSPSVIVHACCSACAAEPSARPQRRSARHPLGLCALHRHLCRAGRSR